MPIKNDGDLIRAVGYVAIYSAYVEEAIEEIITEMQRLDATIDEKIFRQQISQQIKFIKKWCLDHQLLRGQLVGFDHFLDSLSILINQRNEIIHGRIYSVPGSNDVLKPARRARETKVADPAEVYKLANDLFEVIPSLNTVSMFRLAKSLRSVGKN